MHWRLAVGLTGAAGIALATGGLLATQPDRPAERTWTLVRENQRNFTGPYSYLRAHWKATVIYNEQYKRTTAGYQEWVAGPARVVWTTTLEEGSFDMVGVRESSTPGGMGTRARVDTTTTCGGGGTVILAGGPAIGLAAEDLPKFQVSCTSTMRWRDGGGTSTSRSTRRLVVPPEPISESSLTNCRYRESRSSPDEVETYVASLAPADIGATITVDPETYRRFVPVPGATLSFVATVPAGSARFRFELDPAATSRFPGYATNANIDDAFFLRYGLAHLQREYGNDGPDFLFDSAAFNPGEWSRIEPLVVETSRPQSSAGVTVTAMDYGAVGRLQAFVRSDDCSDWQPVEIKLGRESRDALTIPLDDDDNLIADSLEEYKDIASGVDADVEPKGNGMAGDGLTVFEEYRGLLTRGVGCGEESTESLYGLDLGNASQLPGWSDEHKRTSPRSKDLFVHTPDPELALIVPQFANATGLKVHLICEPHYVSNDVRIVNHTLQRTPLREWRGRRISQDDPQHGIRLEPVERLDLLGLALPVREGFIGPPKFTLTVQVRRPGSSSRAFLGGPPEFADLVHTVVHELGHSVGIPHHSDDVDNFRVVSGRLNITTGLSLLQHGGGPPDFTLPDFFVEYPEPHNWRSDGPFRLSGLVIEPGRDCHAKDSNVHYYKGDQFVGCWTDGIARRGQQNSGDFECPMRYSGGAWYYEAPGSVAQFRRTVAAQKLYPNGTLGPTPYLVDVWGGTLLKYRRDLDREGGGPMCKRIAGTGINSLPGDQNHNGDAGRRKACADFIVVNDVAARGIQ
jgi:hypothetical protein